MLMNQYKCRESKLEGNTEESIELWLHTPVPLALKRNLQVTPVATINTALLWRRAQAGLSPASNCFQSGRRGRKGRMETKLNELGGGSFLLSYKTMESASATKQQRKERRQTLQRHYLTSIYIARRMDKLTR